MIVCTSHQLNALAERLVLLGFPSLAEVELDWRAVNGHIFVDVCIAQGMKTVRLRWSRNNRTWNEE